MRALALAALAGLAAADCPQGCPAKCPDPLEIRSDFVKSNFSLDKFWGTYYELQYHDNTQAWYMSCQRSVKSLNPNGRTYKDLFSLHIIANSSAVCDLEFDITPDNGILIGHWDSKRRPDLAGNISNTIVDIGVSANGTYEWSLEFQCIDNATKAAKAGTPSGIQFTAVNFYHKLPLVDDSVIQEMESRLKARGVGWILDVAPGMHKVNQKTCVDHNTYPAKDAQPVMCGQKTALDVLP